MKYNPGDMVRIKSDLKYGRKYGAHYFTKNLAQYMGKEFKIAELRLPGLPNYYYILKGLEDERAYFTDEMLEPAINSNQKTGGLKMDAIEFIKERNRMCDYYKDNRCWNDNEQCPALDCKCHDFRNAADDEFKIVNVVEQWSKNHPKKTMLRDFLEKFPNAPLQSDGTPSLCPYKCGYTREDYCKKFNPNPEYKTCLECWNRPVEG